MIIFCKKPFYIYLLKWHCKVVHVSEPNSGAQTQPPIGMRRIKSLHLFWKRIALFNMLIKNIHVSLCSINLCLENRPEKKCIWKCICQIHQIRWIKYKYKYKYMVWNLIKYKYKYKYAVFVFVFVFANTNTYLTPALVGIYLMGAHYKLIIKKNTNEKNYPYFMGYRLHVKMMKCSWNFHL